MSRRHPVPRTEPGAGTVMVQTPLASLLEATAGVDRFLTLVRSGILDYHRNDNAFDWGPALEPRRHLLPPDMPEVMGALSWRRAPRKWSLDAHHAMLGPDVHYWNSVAKGIAQVRLDGVLIPHTLVTRMEGMVLADVVDHPHLQDRGIIIVSVTSSGPFEKTKFHPASPAMTQFKITVPTIDFADPLPIEWSIPEDAETAKDDA